MIPKSPAKVVQEAQIAGLRALVDILSEKTNKTTRIYYIRSRERLKGVLRKWKKSVREGIPDFSIVSEKENTFRVDELVNIWETTGLYGNTEVKRVKSERDGIIGPVNRFINISGALLRDYILFSFPMPKPVEIGKKRTRTIWGYTSDTVGNVPVAHGADLAELDLADMIRSHGRELARKSSTHIIDYREFSRYALLLIRRLAPFVEYIYSDGDYGRKSFDRPRTKIERVLSDGPCADDILRCLLEEIAGQFGVKRGRVSRLSFGDEKKQSKLVDTFFQDQINNFLAGSKSRSQSKTRREWANTLRILSQGKNPRLRRRDAEYIREQAVTLARWEGTRCHKQMTDGFSQPFNLVQLFKGQVESRMLESKLIVMTEVPISTDSGRGKADIVLLQKEDTGLLKPVAVFEIKTKTGFNWYIVPKKSKSKRKDKKTGKVRKKVVFDPRLRKRSLTEREWQSEIECVPMDPSSKQLDLYERGLVREFNRISGNKSIKGLLKGVILLDSQIDHNRSRKILYSILNSLDYQKLEKISNGNPDRIIIRNKEKWAQRCILVLDIPKPYEIENIGKNIQSLEPLEYNPFHTPLLRKRFILYLSPSSASRSGRTAAWIAKYWHGIRFARAIHEDKKMRKVFWIDLSGMFGEKSLAEVRLRLDRQPIEVEQFFDSIEIIDLSDSINGCLFEGMEPPIVSSLITCAKDSLVIVSGWEFIAQSCPSRLRHLLHELERVLVEDLIDTESHVLWFGVPRSDTRTSLKYHKRCMIPFDASSHLSRYVSRIIWNVPLRPYASNQTTPMLDDVRVIFDHSPDKLIEPELVEIPILRNWSARFWSQRSKKDTKEKDDENKDDTEKKKEESKKGRKIFSASDVLSNDELAKGLKKDATELIPWISRFLKPDKKKTLLVPKLQKLKMQYIPVYGEVEKPIGVLSRLRYYPRPQGVKGQKGMVHTKILLEDVITHPRHYRRKELKSRPIKESQRAPMNEMLVFTEFKEVYSDKTEIRRCRRFLRILSTAKDACFQIPEWKKLLSELEELAQKKQTKFPNEVVREIVSVLRTSEVSNQMWDTLLWVRERRFGDGLRIGERTKLDTLLENRLHISTVYGNYFLLMFVALKLNYPMLNDSQFVFLWGIMKSWILNQIGFTEIEHDEVYGKSKFHPTAIWINLRKRARILAQIPEVHQIRTRFGKLLFNEDLSNPKSGFFLEDGSDRNQILCGFWNSHTPLRVSEQFSWSLSEHRKVLSASSEIGNGESSVHIMIASIKGIDYLWEMVSGDWILVGRVTIIYRRRDAVTKIRGIRIHQIDSGSIPDQPQGAAFPTDFEKRITGTIASVKQRLERVFSVTCFLNIQSGRYVVEFYSEGELVDTRTIASTSDLIALLRTPLVEGVPLISSMSSDVQMTWNLYQDIEYNELMLLKPYVERRTPYIIVEVPLPFTCSELLERSTQDVELVITHDENVCPVIDGFADHGACWKVSPEVDAPKELVTLFQEPVSDTDITSLLSSKELFLEKYRYRLDIEFDPDPSSRIGVVFRENKGIARSISLRPVGPGSFLSIDDEQVVCSCNEDGYGFRLKVRSTISGDIIHSDAFALHEHPWTVKDVVDGFEERIAEVVHLHFGEDEHVSKRIQDYNDLIDSVTEMLKRIKKKKPSRR